MTLNQLLERDEHLAVWAGYYRDNQNQYWVPKWDPELKRAAWEGRMDDPGNVVLRPIDSDEVPSLWITSWATGKSGPRPDWF